MDDATIRERGISALDVEAWLRTRRATVTFTNDGCTIVTERGEQAVSKYLTWGAWEIIKGGAKAAEGAKS